jgi:hypothetical protein
MRNTSPLRPELASVCRFIVGRNVPPSFRPTPLELPARGVLAELAAMKGRA